MKELSVLPTLKKEQWNAIDSNGLGNGSYNPLNYVVMDNVLIQSKYNMNNIEERLLAYLVSLMDLKKPTRQIKVKKIDILNFLFSKTRNKKSTEFTSYYYSRLQRAYENIGKSGVIIKFNNNKGHMVISFCAFLDHEDSDYLIVAFSQEILPFLCYLNGGFTKYLIGYIEKLKGNYSICLYKYLIMKINIRANNKKIVWQENLKDLRFILDIKEKYKKFSNLKKCILEPAIKEINKNTDIQIEYEVIRGGVKNLQIIAIEFKSKKKYKETAIEKANNKSQFPKEVFSKDQNNLEEVKVVETINIKKGDENRNDNSCNRNNNFPNHDIDMVIDVEIKKKEEENIQKKKTSFFKKLKKMLSIYKDM